MNKMLRDPFVLICLGILLFFTMSLFSSLWTNNPKTQLQEAQTAYLEAEATKNVNVRKENFNKSLKILLALEKEYAPTFGNGKLYFDIGSLFFQLEQYSYALLYYYRALNLRPQDEKVLDHIATTQKKLGLSEPSLPSSSKNLFFFHHWFSLPERLSLFFWFGLLSLALFSFCLWFPKRWVHLLAASSLLFSVPLLMSITYTYLFSPVEGVIIESSLLYRDAGLQYTKVKDEPIPAGEKVEVLNTKLGGQWLKIQAKDGSVGYLPQEALRII